MHITVTRTVLEVTKSAAAVKILVLPTFFFAVIVVCVCVFNQDRINKHGKKVSLFMNTIS